MKRISLLILVAVCSILLLGSCRSKKEGVVQQVTTTSFTPWLEEKLATLNERHSEITLYEMDGEHYYAIFVKGPEKSYDLNRTTIYDADGNVYLSLGGPRKQSEKEIEFFQKAQSQGVIWQSDAAIKNAQKIAND